MTFMKKIVSILLIEDDVVEQVEINNVLNRRGILHILKIVQNSDDVLSIIESPQATSFKPDVILIDLTIPKMDHLELLKSIRTCKEWKNAKIFTLSTAEEPINQSEALQYGIAGFITKPLKLENPTSMDAFNLVMDIMNA